MPIVRKTVASKHLKHLKERLKTLESELQGSTPNENIWNQYSVSAEDYRRDFVEIDSDDLSYALSDLEASIKVLKKVNTLKASKLHPGR